MNKKAILISAGAIFVGTNIFLTFKDNSKVDRSSFISEWKTAQKQDITEKLFTDGVVTPFEEHHIYYDDSNGAFKNFLVAEGDQVSSGTPLYELSSENKKASQEKLELEKKQLVKEKKLIEEQIKQLTYLQTVSEANATTAEDDDGTVSASSGDLISLSIEKEIYDKELEISRVESEIDKYDDLIDSNSGSDIGTKSDVEGTVKNINVDLKNPIVTIISDKPKVKGTLTEEELKRVETGMKVKVVNSDISTPGTLTKILPYPEENPSLKKESQFPFEIELDGDNQNLIQGTHVNVSVITNEVKNAVTIPNSAIDHTSKIRYAYVLNEAGKIEKRKLSNGIKQEERTQVEKGVENKEIVATNPEEVLKVKGAFITPLKVSKLEKRWFKAEKKLDIVKYIAAAFSKR